MVELGSFSRAATQLDLSNATVTNHVASLESHFGIRLLNRTTRNVSLTDDGRSCYEHAQRLLAEMTELENILQGAKSIPKGVLRVDVPTAISRLYIAPALPRFAAQYPNVVIKMTVTDRVVNVVEEGVDVLLRIGELKDSTMVARLVHQSRFLCCASAEFLARHGTPKTPDDLAGYPCLGFTQPAKGQVVPWFFEKDGKKTVYTPKASIWINHADSLINAAIAGGGIVQLLSLSLIPQMSAGRLTPILQEWSAIGPPVSVVYPHSRHLSAKVRAFANFVAEVLPKDVNLVLSDSDNRSEEHAMSHRAEVPKRAAKKR